MNRKTKRAMKKQMGTDATEKMAQQVNQFSKLPTHCMACQKNFDKLDKQMVSSWHVVVKQDVVRLFCPDCIKKTQEALNVSNENI